MKMNKKRGWRLPEELPLRRLLWQWEFMYTIPDGGIRAAGSIRWMYQA